MSDAPVHYLRISIKDSVRSSESFPSHINYNIETNSNIPGYVYGDKLVARRYSDFSWLAAELSRVCPGCIIPALPEKQTVALYSVEFVESRRRALERFVLNVAAHKELCISPVFISFLQADDSALKIAKDASKSGAKKMTTNAIAWIEGKVNLLSTGKVSGPSHQMVHRSVGSVIRKNKNTSLRAHDLPMIST